MSGTSRNQLGFRDFGLGKHQDSRENKTNCFPRDMKLSVLNI